jgi:putative phosphoserine phosphatase/1-acylglycerol-3-phosphate O-acyltransferase
VRASSAQELRERGPRIEFFEQGVRKMRWHASQGHKIFLVSGTLEALAQLSAQELVEILRRDESPEAMGVCATRLEENAGRWTGEVSGEAIWGMAKARAIERISREHGIDLSRSFAYANSENDCAMLAKVGHPTAVNPSTGLKRIAEAAGWPVILWTEHRKIQKPAGPRLEANAGSFERF